MEGLSVGFLVGAGVDFTDGRREGFCEAVLTVGLTVGFTDGF
jgi:hypothetical protein